MSTQTPTEIATGAANAAFSAINVAIQEEFGDLQIITTKLNELITNNISIIINEDGSTDNNEAVSLAAAIVTNIIFSLVSSATESELTNTYSLSLEVAYDESIKPGSTAVQVAVATINFYYDYPSFRNLEQSVYQSVTSAVAAGYAAYYTYSTYEGTNEQKATEAATAGQLAGTAGQTAETRFTSLPCFTAGSLILTPNGYKKIEELKNGDSVTTSDGRTVQIKVTSTKLTTTKKTAPYLIPKGCLGYGIPKNDLRLSPNHAIRIKKGVWVIPRLAKDIYKQIKQYGIGDTISYYHLETPNFYKDHLMCNESIVESYSGHQMDSVEQELYYQKNLYAHYLSGVSETTSEADHKESFEEFSNEMISCPNYLCINDVTDNTNFI